MWYHVYDGDPFQKAHVWTCYAESRDGIHWEKPNLGLVSWRGSTENNILLPNASIKGKNASIIRDLNAPAAERYKMVFRRDGVYGYISADGLRWTGVETNPFLTEGPFDSHNTLLWDQQSQRYVVYLRAVDPAVAGPFFRGRRAIRRSESVDFRRWSQPKLVVTADNQDPTDIHFYTNAAVKYFRADNAYLMFPMILHQDRKHPRSLSSNAGTSEVQFASSRNGLKWNRPFRQAFISPGLDERNWVDRNPIMGQGIVQTGPNEISMYYSELYYSDETRIRRCTLRTDGFVSVGAPNVGWGEFTTHPLVFSGRELELNYSTGGGGSVLVELQTPSGEAIQSFALNDCYEIFGDTTAGFVRWKQQDLGMLAGKPVRLRVKLRDAQLYAFRFAV